MQIRLNLVPRGYESLKPKPKLKSIYFDDLIDYDPVTTSLDAYVVRLQTWPLESDGKMYRATHGRWSEYSSETIFLIDMMEE